MAKGDLTLELDKVSYQKLTSIIADMEKVDQTSTIRNALSEGMQVIVNAGKVNLSSRNGVKTGNLKKSFTKKVVKKTASAYGGFKRSAPSKRISGGNHSYLVDRGTAKRYTKKGAYRGSVSKGKPNTGSMFWTDAVNTQGNNAVNRLMDAIYESLDKISRK